MEGEFGEDKKPLLGEGATVPPTPHFEEPIREKKLTFEEASQCLNTLGKDESGVRYAYLMITASEKKLTDVSTILNFKHVLFLDLSGNFLNLEALQVLAGMPFLIFLKAERNRIESVALDPIYYLQALILNKNQIAETCDINQPMLDSLELGDNLIYTAQFDVERLANLKMLSLKGNHLIDLSGSYPCELERLYVAQNQISKINLGFLSMKNLKILHLRENLLRKLDGFTEELENLTYLNLRGNKINKVRQFRKLASLPKLDTLILLENPLYGEEEPPKGEEVAKEEAEDEEEALGEEELTPTDKMRLPLLVLLPNLKRINKEMVTYDERDAAEIAKKKITDEIFAEESSEEETEMPSTTDFTTDYTTETEIDKEEEGEGEDDEEMDENDQNM